MLKLLTVPISWIYAAVTSIRNKFFDLKIFKSEEYDIPIVCVGNLSVGGTGKTPHTEMLVRMLSPYYNIAILSRGYKRKTKGFFDVSTSSSSKIVGDEPKQIKQRFPDILVAVCEDRRVGIRTIRAKNPDINLIILDDGFQHRYVETWLNILLTDHAKPFYDDKLLPWGRLRESVSGMGRAQIVVVTKTPVDIKPIEMRLISKYLNLFPYQSLFFTHMVQKEPVPVFEKNRYTILEKGSRVIAMAAIADPTDFIDQLKRSYDVVDTIIFSDHYQYKKRDLNVIISKLASCGDDVNIITTEKDAVKFASSKKIPADLCRRMFKIPIEVEFVEADHSRLNTAEHFFNRIIPYVKQNQKYNTLNP
ncbi:MAG: tetraacyldisaccharide 4'-kinase [Rikenellaceae bacterium]